MLKKSGNVWLVLLLILGVGLACGLGDQTDEANKLVDEANVGIKTYNENTIKSSKLFNDLYGDSLKNVEDLDDYKTANKAKFEELKTLSEQLDKSGNELSDKFDKASKLKLNDKYKEYLSLKAQEFKKRADADKLVPPFVKSFAEAKDADAVNKLIDDYNKKSADLAKESDDISKKADQIVKDNPSIIKGN
jgi:DNA repair exonuclease SbcCD ATPase subunit